jgi:hypothetical protein
LILLVGLLAAPAAAQDGGRAGAPVGLADSSQPAAMTHSVQALDAVERVATPRLDLRAIAAEDAADKADGLPPRFAIPNDVLITPSNSGTWENIDDKTLLWRMRIAAPDALSVNLGFTRYHMPDGGRLLIYAADQSYSLRPYTSADNKAHGELWTPVVLGDDIVVEVTIPEAVVGELELELTSINHGYRFFGEKKEASRSGYCNNDVICPEGDPWRDEIQSVSVLQRSGSRVCTGFMVNNTAEDETPYYMTAYHCEVTSSNDNTVVVYWNYESPTCGQQGGGSLSQNQSGSVWRAGYYYSDFTLIELDDMPNPAHNVTYAGWDRTSANPTSAVGIHHPSVDEKSISFENNACTTTDYYGTSTPGDGTHIRVIDWDDGTTEGGSSGSPLFNQNHHVVGQLHGGDAACGNNESDWYGRFSASWTGGGSSSSRLSNWLDPLGTGQTTLDILVPGASGLEVTPTAGLDSAGDSGGPFTPSSRVYTLENLGSSGFSYSVTKTQNWVSVTNASGYLSGHGSTTVTVSINSNANSLGDGSYADTVSFVNTTNHTGDTTRDVTLQVGGPRRLYNFPMDTNPGWTTEGDWAFGQPTGNGGEHGEPDPTSGYTGSNVYGYNLGGDYPNYLAETHLTSTAIDCSGATGVTVRFYRWLNVERDSYDHAYFRVSNGGSYTTFWQNGLEVTDDSWQYQEFDISSIADGQPTVYLRWTMGTTDYSYRYSGWNIDDVQIWGIAACSMPGDMDENGTIDGDDISAFVACKIDGGSGCACATMDISDFVNCLLNGGTCP